MARIWKSAGTETLREWVTAIIDEASDDLNDWENQFISDMQIRIANEWPLTQSQEETLEKIYAEKTK